MYSEVNKKKQEILIPIYRKALSWFELEVFQKHGIALYEEMSDCPLDVSQGRHRQGSAILPSYREKSGTRGMVIGISGSSVLIFVWESASTK